MGYDVLTSGYASMDHVIKIASPARIGYTSLVTNKNNVDIFYGGCSVNIAYALCKLGMNAMPELRVGADYEKNGFQAFLEEGKVPMEGITVLPEESTSTCYLLQDNNHDHITVFYPGAMDEKYAGPLPEEHFKDTRLGVITVASQKDNKEFFKQCKKHQVPVVFGMKDDFDAFPKDFLEELLLESTIIFTNEVERQIIEEMYGMEDITQFFQKGRVELLITTLGKDGSICYERCKDGIKEHQVGICAVEQVVDATGSGDAYISGFIYGYLKGKSVEDCCKLGASLSHFVIQKEGCCTNIPTKEQLEKKVEEWRI
ncbi:MAG: PfkB family carbohydrate kinase [Acetivibrio sp.]